MTFYIPEDPNYWPGAQTHEEGRAVARKMKDLIQPQTSVKVEVCSESRVHAFDPQEEDQRKAIAACRLLLARLEPEHTPVVLGDLRAEIARENERQRREHARQAISLSFFNDLKPSAPSDDSSGTSSADGPAQSAGSDSAPKDRTL